MMPTIGDNRKMEMCTDGGDYYGSTNFIGYTSPGYEYRETVKDIVQERLQNIANTFDYKNDERGLVMLRNMMGLQLNDLTEIVETVTNQRLANVQSLTGSMVRCFNNFAKISTTPTRSDYEHTADDVILDAIKNGMIMAYTLSEDDRIEEIKHKSKIVGKVETTLPVQQIAVAEKASEKPVIKKAKKFKVGERYLIYPMKNKMLRREYIVKKNGVFNKR